jgi:hypothetical protein
MQVFNQRASKDLEFSVSAEELTEKICKIDGLESAYIDENNYIELEDGYEQNFDIDEFKSLMSIYIKTGYIIVNFVEYPSIENQEGYSHRYKISGGKIEELNLLPVLFHEEDYKKVLLLIKDNGIKTYSNDF